MDNPKKVYLVYFDDGKPWDWEGYFDVEAVFFSRKEAEEYIQKQGYVKNKEGLSNNIWAYKDKKDESLGNSYMSIREISPGGE